MRDGKVTETRSSAHGIQHLPLPGVPGYEKAFAEIAGRAGATRAGDPQSSKV